MISEKPWLDHYPEGVPHNVDSDLSATTVVELFQNACSEFSDQTSFISMGRELTYGELKHTATTFASYLQSLKLDPGFRVAIMMPNLIQYPISIFGTLIAGGIVVNVNPLYTARELKHQLKDSGVEVIVILENFAHILEEVIAETSVKHVVVTPMGELLSPIKKIIVNFVIRHFKKMVPAWKLPGSIDLKTALFIGDDRIFDPVTVVPDDIAFLQYTGGTTGVSKGAVLKHKNITTNVKQAKAWITPVVKVGEECILTPLPLYHIFALTANCLTFMSLGAKILLIVNPRDIPAVIKEWSKYPVTAVTGVNTLFNAFNNHEDFPSLDFSTMNIALAGGMALQSSVAKQWRKITDVPIFHAYGLTETSPAVTIMPTDDPEYNGSIGLPLPSTEITIRDDNDNILELEETGEICVRGPQVMEKYWQRPDETAIVMTEDAFLKTGDIGRIDSKGFVYLIDRKKDMIIVSGFNVYPNEIEDVASSHPSVLEVAAIGVPDEKTGEAVKLFVVRKEDTLSEQAITSHCRESLTAYKVPKIIEFRDSLPKTNVGKILRRGLR